MRHRGKRRKRVSPAAPARGPPTKRTGGDSRRGQSQGSEAQAGIRSAARSPRPPGPPGCPAVLPTRLVASSARSRSGLTTKMAARPAPDKDARPPARPPPRPGPKRKDDLPITESLLFPRIHYHQCPAVCVCVGEGESGREAGGRARAREAGGQRAAPAPGLGAPSAARRTSPLLAPALPGHLPPSPPLTVGRGSGTNYTAAARAGGRGREAVFWSRADSEHLQHLPLLRLRHRLPSSPRRRRRVLKARRLLPLPLPLLPPPPLHQLHPGNSAVAAFGKARQFPPHPPPTHPTRLEDAAFGKPRLAPALLFL